MHTIMPVSPLAQQSSPMGGLESLVPFVAMFAIFYFLLIRPQQKKEAERQTLLSKLKKNDHVLTQGGMYGVVVAVKDDEVTLKVDEKQDVRIRFARSAIATILGADGSAGEKPET